MANEEIMLETLLSKATDSKVIGTGSIFDTLKEANKIATEVDRILSVMEKYKLIEPLRLYFYKKNGLDKVHIAGENSGIIPSSPTHELAFIELNKMSEKDLQEHANQINKPKIE